VVPGDKVRTSIPLPHRPADSVGTVREVGAYFVVVEFDEGRWGYYLANQLEREPEEYLHEG
jgi:hypothetical protein